MFQIKCLLTIYAILLTFFKADIFAAEETVVITSTTAKSRAEITTSSLGHLQVDPLNVPVNVSADSLHWCAETQNLFFTDINSGRLLRYDHQLNKIYSCQIENELTTRFVVPLENSADTFVVGAGPRIVYVQWANGLTDTTCKIKSTLIEPQTEDNANERKRFKVGKCDPRGRLFAGTTHTYLNENRVYSGEFYKFEKGGQAELLKYDVGIANGLAWNEQMKKFYFVDSGRFEVVEFDYDVENGVASNPKVLYSFHKTNETLLPAGLTIDTEGNIYVAVFNNNTVYKISPITRQIKLEIKFPVKRITSLTFGGPNLDILFVSSSRRINEIDPPNNIYKVSGLGAKGLRTPKMII